ncbi:MAG: Hsp70 family protein, partial [Rhizobiales bacterium]|nr:Hsp70 family protein [Rhizobacter sp.]
AARVRVSFAVDADGLLNVTAREETSGVEAAISVKPSYGLADDEIARMLTESFSTAEADMVERSLRESRVEAERMLLATRAALKADGDLLTAADHAHIEALLGALQASRESTDHHAIDAAVEALAKGTESFAAERMNRSIRVALAGRSVDQI